MTTMTKTDYNKQMEIETTIAVQGGLSTALELLCGSQVLVVGESMTRAAYRQGMSRVLVA